MHFDSWSDFFAMGGYAFYVWSAFVITLLLLKGLYLVSVREQKRLVKDIKNQLARQKRIEEAKKMENRL